MGRDEKVSSLEGLLDRMGNAASDGGRVSLDAILDAVGLRSFGPVLLLAGLITLAPLIGDIPGVPTVMAALVLFTATQLAAGREQIWLPRWMLSRTVSHDAYCNALGRMRRPARWMDRWTGPRLGILIRGVGTRVVAVVCVAIALAMPAMELVPFSANGAGLALAAFGLALIARDGLLALIAFTVTVGTVTGVLLGLL